MTLKLLALLAILAPALAAAPAPTAEAALEPGVVELALPKTDDNAWAPVEDARNSTRFAEALSSFLQAHPHGPQAARALAEQAAREDDLFKAEALLKQARSEGKGSEAGSAAALAQAHLEYAQDRPAAALQIMEEAEPWPRPEAIQAEWLYWRAQCRLVLKGWQRARDDLRQLAATWPKHPRAEEARLGQAECDAALGQDDSAAAGFTRLSSGPFAAQALWGLASLRQRQGDVAEARRLFLRLRHDYPASFEAEGALARLDALAKLPQPTPAPAASKAKACWLQVGAFSRQVSADKLARQLRAKGYKVKVQLRKVDGRSLRLVKAGPYASRAKAEAAGKRLAAKERMIFRIVEE